jgi:hypothetical protein
MQRQTNYWFPAKRVGWGWSLPNCWQGWAVLGAYAACIVLILQFLPLATDPVAHWVAIGLATAVLVTVCWLKGERPGTRG